MFWIQEVELEPKLGLKWDPVLELELILESEPEFLEFFF
jgi:hypothetical protein